MKVENAVASSSQSGLDVGIENSTDGKNQKKNVQWVFRGRESGSEEDKKMKLTRTTRRALLRV